ncbi:hypothetical protein LDENG_00205810 [Lucifuga dentata]|nr:hypothetical protein LDENG_00205810 [Lucifuga dentata]
MLPLHQILQDCGVSYHSYADDTQIYLALSPSDYGPVNSLCLCLEKVNKWMLQNFLQLNKDKTEIIIFGNNERRQALNAYLDSKALKTSTRVRNLGIIFDEDINFSYHIKAVTKASFWHLKNIAKIRNFVSKEDLEKIIHAFISCRVDYCKSLFTGLPNKSIKQLQLIQNAADKHY